MKNNQNVITRKIKYSVASPEDADLIFSYIKNYNNVLRFTFNRLKENPVLKSSEIARLQKGMNNIFIDTHFLGSAVYNAKSLINSTGNNKVIFGGKKLMLSRCKGNITNEEWKRNRLIPLCSIGQANMKGNRKFSVVSSSQILFKPSKNTHILLNIPRQNKKTIKELEFLITLQENNKIPITYKLDTEYIYITYDYSVLKKFIKPNKKIRNRVIAVDLNPNYIGYSVVDWQGEFEYKIIDKGVFSIENINNAEMSLKVYSDNPKRKYYRNKRIYELKQFAKEIVEKANHYGCELFGLEDLTIKPKDAERGTKYNRLCNNLWCRNNVREIINKYCSLYDIRLVEIEPSFSSYIGNIVFRKEHLPDMVLSSIEIGRRAYEFYNQYIIKTLNVRKNIIFPNLERVKNIVIQSLEELNINVPFTDLRKLYYTLKNEKNFGQRYRVPLSSIESFRKYYKKKKVFLYTFK